MQRYLTLMLLLCFFQSLMAQVDEKSSNLLLAAWNNDAAGVKLWLDSGALVNAASEEGVTALMYAAENGNTEIIKMLIDAGADIQLKPADGYSALSSACLFNQIDAAIMLIEAGAAIEATTVYGATPLMIGAAYGHYIICDMLLYYGARTEATDGAGNTALHIAATHGFSGIAALLLKGNAMPDSRDDDALTPLMCAVIKGHVSVVDTLLSYKADINLQDNKGYTPLMMAIRGKNDTLIRLLYKQDYNKGIKNKYGQTAADLALLNGNYCMYRCLIDSASKSHTFLRPGSLRLQSGFSGTSNDVLWGYGFSLNDTRFGLRLSIGHDMRMGKKKILVPQEGQQFKQFNEKRHLLYAGISKDIPFWRSTNKEAGASAGLYYAYTTARIGGTYYKPFRGGMWISAAGVYYKTGIFSCSLDYRYMNFKTYKLPPHYLSLRAAVDINLRKNPSHKKTIYWIY